MPADESQFLIEEVTDERTDFAVETLALMRENFLQSDRHDIAEFALEIAEKRLGFLTLYDFHLLGATNPEGRVVAMGAGVYLVGVNAGLVTYLAVRPEWRRHRLGARLRVSLVDRFRENSQAAGWDELAWVVGEVRVENPWLGQLVRRGGVIPFDLEYYHPGMTPGKDHEKYILYRERIADRRSDVPVEEVRRLLYSIYHRAYRVRYPLQREGFRAMLSELEGRTTVGMHPDYAVERD